MRFFLIDKVLELNYHKDITGVKSWSLDNEIFLDHFPGFPIVPGVLLTESMAQLLGLLIEKSYYQEYGTKQKVYPMLSIIQKAKFRGIVKPGDQCLIKAELSSLDSRRANGKARIEVNGEFMAEAVLSFTIGTENDIPYTQFMKRREEYIEIVFANTQIK
jgi:3-hydroxyacyl-[acyl-carrier-protein] dehydratase